MSLSKNFYVAGTCISIYRLLRRTLVRSEHRSTELHNVEVSDTTEA